MPIADAKDVFDKILSNSNLSELFQERHEEGVPNTDDHKLSYEPNTVEIYITPLSN